MNIAPILIHNLKGVGLAMKGTLSDTKIASISETINNYAVAAAVASGVAGVAPGIAGVAAVLTQAGFVWATYVKINQTLGISMSENTAKFIGSAIVTNLVTNAGAFVAMLVGSTLLSFIPIAGTAAAIALNASLGYVLVYAAAVIYLKLITRMVQPDGTLNVAETDDTKHIIRDIIKETNIKDIVKEGKASYKQAQADGSIDKAKNAKKCTQCGASLQEGQRFCSECGAKII